MQLMVQQKERSTAAADTHFIKYGTAPDIICTRTLPGWTTLSYPTPTAQSEHSGLPL